MSTADHKVSGLRDLHDSIHGSGTYRKYSRKYKNRHKKSANRNANLTARANANMEKASNPAKYPGWLGAISGTAKASVRSGK